MHHPPPALILKPALTLKEVSLTLKSAAGPVNILQDISLDIPAGQTIVVQEGRGIIRRIPFE